MQKFAVRATIAAIAFATQLGCLPTHRFDCDLAAKNIGAVELDDVRIEFEGFNERFGILVPDAHSQLSGIRGRIPTSATLYWHVASAEDGTESSATVKIPLERPSLTHGRDERFELRFELDGKSVTPIFIVNDFTRIHEWEKQQGSVNDSNGSSR